MQEARTAPYIDVEQKAAELGVAVPDAVWILPSGFEAMTTAADPTYAADYDLVVKLLKGAGLPYSLLHSGEASYPKLIRRSFHSTALPLLVFAKKVLASHPDIVPQALGAIHSYLKGRSLDDPEKDRHTVRCTIARARNGGYVRGEYDGPLEGFVTFIEAMR